MYAAEVEKSGHTAAQATAAAPTSFTISVSLIWLMSCCRVCAFA
jgi:hypothetical protein